LGRYLAEHIPGAKLVELPGADLNIVWETPELAVDCVEEFLTGVRRAAEPSRVMATVLFTDIVGSTELAGRLGDRRWRELVELHDELARQAVEEFGGQLAKTTGDGILATFDGPGRAIRCAAALSDEWLASVSSCGQGCTPARSSCAIAMSAASPCTSRPG
jgi:class 3 adenylate cyclase